MKILLLITGLGMGGAEQVVARLADALAARGHDVRIAYITGSEQVRPRNPNVRVIGLGMSTKFEVIPVLFRLRRLIREFRPDVVHSHMVHANLLGRFARLVSPVSRLISTAHSSNEGGNLRMLAYRLSDPLADLSTNVSAEAVAEFERRKAVKAGRMLAVYNGVDVARFSFDATARTRVRAANSMAHDACLILAVGRLSEAKDYPNLLQALAQSSAGQGRSQLWIVGEGPLRPALENLAMQLGVAHRVRFLGVRHDVVDLMSAADAFALSSAWEGFPMVVLEAMANERVVVATDCGGVREAVGTTGFLVPPRDSTALAKALDDALQLPADQKTSLGRSARERVSDLYSLDAAAAKWLELYASKA